MKALPLVLALAVLAALPWIPRLQAQDLPEGKGKDLVQTMCSGCHGLESVVSQRADKSGWENIVGYMMSRGMVATDDEFNTMVDYLAKAFPQAPKQKPAETPAPSKP